MNKYLKIFLSTGTSFGIAMGLFYAFQQGSFSSGVAGGLVAGILFGSEIAIFSYGADRKLRAKGYDRSNSSVRQFHALEANRPTKDIFPLCRDALLSIKKCKVKNENQEIGAIRGKVGMSWKSFGELVEVSVKPSGNNKTLIEITSKPNIPTTMVDYGKNQENVEAIVGFLRQRIGDGLAERA